jgi:Transmembrane secretion effector
LLGGAITEGVDVGAAYVVYTVLLGIAFVTLIPLPYEQPAGPRREVSIAAIKEGIRYVRTHQVPLGAMTLDMFAVLFGGAKGLLPIYAKDILHAGPLGYTVLLSSLEIGALAMSVALVLRPPIYRSGRALVYSVVAFGLLSVAFGLSRNIYVSIVLYMLIGMADEVSVVMRNVLIQLTTPDELRGRVSSVNQVFIQASNQLGSTYSGFMAAVTSAPFATVSGGLAAVGIAVLVGFKMKELFNYVTVAHAPVPLHEPPQTTEEAASAAGGSA